jgi:hypothetical protein
MRTPSAGSCAAGGGARLAVDLRARVRAHAPVGRDRPCATARTPGSSPPTGQPAGVCDTGGAVPPDRPHPPRAGHTPARGRHLTSRLAALRCPSQPQAFRPGVSCSASEPMAGLIPLPDRPSPPRPLRVPGSLEQGRDDGISLRAPRGLRGPRGGPRSGRTCARPADGLRGGPRVDRGTAAHSLHRNRHRVEPRRKGARGHTELELDGGRLRPRALVRSRPPPGACRESECGIARSAVLGGTAQRLRAVVLPAVPVPLHGIRPRAAPPVVRAAASCN